MLRYILCAGAALPSLPTGIFLCAGYPKIFLAESRESGRIADFIGTFDAVPPGANYSSKQKSYMDKIFMEQAWEIQTGSNTITVGVIDTGIQHDHAEFTNRIKGSLSRDFTFPIFGIDTPNPIDPWGHGSKVAGIIGMKGVNAIGVCWNIKVGFAFCGG